MKTRSVRTQTSGLTLIELLVVLGILAAIVGISVPAFVRLGSFAHTDRENAARELYTILRAARVYAATQHVDAGVAYAVASVVDSRAEIYTRVINAASVVRRLRPEEAAALGRPSDAFVPVEGEQGRFRSFPTDACVRDDALRLNGEGEDASSLLGLTPIFVYDRQGNLIRPRPGQGYWGSDAFHAHVFKPSGLMEQFSGKARFVLNVTSTPDADVDEQDLPPIRVELSAATGRVKIAT